MNPAEQLSEVVLARSQGFVFSRMERPQEREVVELIRRNLEGFEEAGTVLTATFRRLDNFYPTYRRDGSDYLVVVEESTGTCVGGAGLGPLAGLPASDGVGEVRDMVLDPSYRGRGLGTILLRCCMESARAFGYRRLYLETTPQMSPAQRLFRRFGFRPVTEGQQSEEAGKPLPCYFVLEPVSAFPAAEPA